MAGEKLSPAALAGAIRAGDINLLTGGIDGSKDTAPKRRPQAQKWLVPGWLPAGTVTLVQSALERDGRTLGLQLALCFAAGSPFLGHAMQRGPNAALFLSTTATLLELKHASVAIEREIGLPRAALKKLFFCKPDAGGWVLGRADGASGELKPTAIYEALCNTVAEQRPGVIVLDSLPDLFAGDHFDHRHTGAFMALMDQLCEISGATMLLLAPADFGAYR